jgi:acetyltransferase
MEAKEALDKILMPKSVAVVGASTDPFKWGNMLLAAIQKSGFEGDIYPINPKAEEILGLKCYTNVRDIPNDVDSALVVVPARFVPSVFEDMVAKGIKGAVVITSGFGETGEEGREAIRQIRETSEGKLRFIGPNCMGVTSSPLPPRVRGRRVHQPERRLRPPALPPRLSPRSRRRKVREQR